MNKTILIIGLVLLLVVSSGCEMKQKQVEQVEIVVSSTFKEAIEKAAPAKEYGFYAYKESYPESIEEMIEAKLVVCGEVEPQAAIKVMMASLDDLDTLLFKSVSHHIINPNILSGLVVISETVSITLESGEVMQFPRKKLIYGRETPVENLIQECFEEIQENNKSVLLMKRNVGHKRMIEEMVEIVFK